MLVLDLLEPFLTHTHPFSAHDGAAPLQSSCDAAASANVHLGQRAPNSQCIHLADQGKLDAK